MEAEVGRVSGKPRMTRSRYVYVYNLARDSVRRRRTIMLSKHLVFFASTFLIGRGGRDRSPGSGEYYILASVHYVTGERQSLVGRIRDWILRGWRNLNPHLLPGGRTQEIQWVFATIPSDPIPFSSSSSFFLKVRITLFSETWKTRFRRLRRRHLSGCSFFLRDDTALLHGPLSPCTHAPRVCTHILNNYAPPWSNFATGGFNVRLAPPFRPWIHGNNVITRRIASSSSVKRRRRVPRAGIIATVRYGAAPPPSISNFFSNYPTHAFNVFFFPGFFRLAVEIIS